MTHPILQDHPLTVTEQLQVLLYLYSQQTSAERNIEATTEANSRGFNAFDAPILSSLAMQVLSGKGLSDRQLNVLKLRLGKYQGQLRDNAWRMLDVPALVSARPRGLSTPQSCAGVLGVAKGVGGRWGLTFKPQVYPSNQIKSIGFTRWEDKLWWQSMPSINQTAVNDILKLFGDSVVVTPAVTDLLNNMAKPMTLPATLQADLGLFDYQMEAIQFLCEHPHSLLALDPGLGKTACSLLAATLLNCQRVLIVAPLSLLYNWRKEVKKWTAEDAMLVYKNQLPFQTRWTITNYDTLRLHSGTFIAGDWDAIIIDESLLIKGRRTKRTEVVTRLCVETHCPNVWLLSGAPASKFVTDMWSQFHALDPQRFTSFWRWAERYVLIESNQWSKYNIVANKPDAVQNIKADHQDVYFAMSQADTGLGIPDWIFDTLTIPLTPAQDKLYRSMQEKFLAELNETDTLFATTVLTQLLRLVQFASNPVLVGGVAQSSKWDACEELLQFEALPAIVWTSFIETANGMLDRLQMAGLRVAKLTGATPMAERDQIVTDFQAGRLDVIVAHPAVGKYGLTLTAARTAIYLERGYNADDYLQSLYRIKRIGTTQSPHVILLLAEQLNGEPTVDHVIDKILSGRKDMMQNLTSAVIHNLFQKEPK